MGGITIFDLNLVGGETLEETMKNLLTLLLKLTCSKRRLLYKRNHETVTHATYTTSTKMQNCNRVKQLRKNSLETLHK